LVKKSIEVTEVPGMNSPLPGITQQKTGAPLPAVHTCPCGQFPFAGRNCALAEVARAARVVAMTIAKVDIILQGIVYRNFGERELKLDR